MNIPFTPPVVVGVDVPDVDGPVSMCPVSMCPVSMARCRQRRRSALLAPFPVPGGRG